MKTIPKKILVTGVAGFLVSNVLTKLLSERVNVFGLDNPLMGSLKNIRTNLNHKNFVFFKSYILRQSIIDGLENDLEVITNQ